jgi:hypothetical protein
MQNTNEEDDGLSLAQNTNEEDDGLSLALVVAFLLECLWVVT